MTTLTVNFSCVVPRVTGPSIKTLRCVAKSNAKRREAQKSVNSNEISVKFVFFKQGLRVRSQQEKTEVNTAALDYNRYV